MSELRRDAALRELLSDLIVEILKHTGNPAQCGDHLTSQIRDLIGVRFVLLAEFNAEIEPVSFCPSRRKDIWEDTDFRRFAELAAKFDDPAILRPGPDEIGQLAARLGYRESFVVPLSTGFEKVGMLLLVDLMDSSGISAILEALKSIAGVMALILRNAILYRNLELLVAERTRELAESEKKFRSLVDNLPGVVYRCDINAPWAVHYISEGVAALTGRSPLEFITAKVQWADIVHPDDLAAVDGAVRSAIENNTSYQMEYRIIFRDGAFRWVSERGKCVRDADGTPLYLDGVILDITSRKAAESSLRFTQFAVDHAGEAVYWADERARLLYANDMATSATGYTREELTGMSVFDLDPNYGPEEWRSFLPGLKQKGSVVIESLHRRKDGSVFPVEMTVSYVEFEGQAYLCGFGRDISERRRVEEEIRRWGHLFQQAGFGLAVADVSNNTFLIVNPAFARERGYRPEELIGRPVLSVYPPDLHEDLKKRFKLYENLPHDVFESEHIRKDGTRFPVLMEVTTIRDRNETPVNRIAYSLDITDRKKADAEREHLQKQLIQSQKMEAIGILAGGVAHDFNNILQGMMGNLYLLKMKSHEPAVAETSDTLLMLAQKAADLTRGMLAYSRQQVFTLKTEDMNDVVRDALKLVSRVLGEDIRIQTKYGGDKMPVQLDSGQIQQVLLNLATNARDAMPGGGVLLIATGTIRIEDAGTHGVDTPGDYAVITVTDSGTGISRKNIEHIFEPFFTTKEVGKGTGLGLAMIYGIVKQHNGTVTVYSELNQGTTFRLYFPMLPTEQQKQRSGSARPEMIGGKERILIVEDDADVQSIMKRLLEALGYSVLACGEPDDAIETFRREAESIDLVLLDIIMPRKSGTAVFDEMVRIKPSVKALFVSGYPADFLHEKGVSLENVRLIMKPVIPQELAASIRSILSS